MKPNALTSILCISGLFIFLSACVTANEHEKVLASNRMMKGEINRYMDMEADYDRLQKSHEDLQKQYNESLQKTSDCEERYQRLDEARQDLQEVYEKILNQNRQLLETSSQEKKDLLDQLARKKEELDMREKKLSGLAEQLQQQSEETQTLKQRLLEKEARINELSDQLNQMNDRLANTLAQIKNALVDFEENELSVRQEDGKVYVSLSQQLLFEKGSSSIGTRGKEALAQLAGALQQIQDLSITVEGHTDSDGGVQRNWELSTERATSVVVYLQSKGVDPNRMIASGRAFYAPVAPNDNAANKALNRRTEIIINPDLEAVFQLLDASKEE
jgi:chemotaxis protein MotB